MKVELLKDVLTPHNGVGTIGQVVEMSASDGRDYIKAGLAKEAADDADALPVDVKKAPAGPITTETLKKKPGADRETKTEGPDETK